MKIPNPFNSWEEYFSARDAFYKSTEWKELRKIVIENNDCKCVYCGREPTKDNPINIDHIQPLCKRWDLRLDINNLQITCSECNKRKGGKSHKRFKKTFEPKPKYNQLSRKQKRKERLKRKKIREEKQRIEQKRKNDAFFANYLK